MKLRSTGKSRSGRRLLKGRVKRHRRNHIIANNQRIVARRLELVKHTFGLSREQFVYWATEHAGKLRKWNLVCSCPLCRDPKYRDTRAREKIKARKLEV